MRIKILIYKTLILKKAVIFQFILIFFIFAHSTYIHASRQIINVEQKIDKSDMMHWTTVINDKIFDVYVDRDNEIIFIYGEVNSFYEKEKVVEYFILKKPSNYKLISQLTINNSLDK